MNPSVKKLDYLPGLDGIRALAALLVILTHWPNNALSLKFGWIGVNIFFVLSGFLITRILLNEKQKDFKLYIQDFFYRRALRIFPAYYLFFFGTSLLLLLLYWLVPALANNQLLQDAVYTVKHDTLAYLTYTLNLKMNLAYFLNWPMNHHALLGHVWSLAVEEQFYIIFPFIVYFASPTALKKLLMAILIVCPLIRLWAALVAVNMVSNRYWLGEFIYTNTFCQADSLAAGALLAVHPIKIKFRYINFIVVSALCLVVGLTCLYFLRKAGHFWVEGKSLGFDFPGFWFDQKTPWLLIKIRAFYQYTLVNLFALVLIAPATIHQPLFPKIFNWQPLVYFGRMSYGVYLYHGPLLGLLMMFVSLFGNWFAITSNLAADVGFFLIYLAMVILVAHLSYKYFEQKILARYKHAYAKH